MRKEPFVWDLSVSMLSVVDDDGFMGVQPEVYGDSPSMVPFELHHSFGFVARPRDPDVDANSTVEPGGACTILTATEGDKSYAWLAGDPRYVGIIPEIKKGGSCQYGATGTLGNIDGEDGTWTKYVPYEWNASGVATKSHAIQIGVDANGDPLVSIVHGDGMAITLMTNELAMRNAAGDVRVELKSDGLYLIGNIKIIGALLSGEGAVGYPMAVWNTAFTAWVAQVTAAINLLAPSSITPPLTALTGGTITSLGQ